jgi:hypothetical protein
MNFRNFIILLILTYSKVVKVVQYFSVCISEFNFVKVLCRVFLRRKATQTEVQEWFKRFKLLGSSLSTVRMALRLLIGIDGITYLLKQINAYRNNSKLNTLTFIE